MLFHFLNFSQCSEYVWAYNNLQSYKSQSPHQREIFRKKKKNPFSRTTTNCLDYKVVFLCFLPSSNPELIESFVSGWGERYCNNTNYVKNNAIFEPPSMRACSSTPLKQNQDFVKEHNRTPLTKTLLFVMLQWGVMYCFVKYVKTYI